MRIVVAGGTGFLGRALVSALRADGHQIYVLTRRPRTTQDVEWAPGSSDTGWMVAVHQAEVVINLAGEPIAARRWTAARKALIRDSRVAATRALVEAIQSAPEAPATLVNASGVGYYGDRGDETLTESSTPGRDFLADVCRAWEGTASEVPATTRVVLLRTGLVLAKDDGALPRLALPFRAFAGGPAGSGRQYMSWIHVDDWVGIARRAVEDPAATGPLNLVGPAPVTNAEFATSLGAALGRPAMVPAPAFALKLALGEMAQSLILSSQRALPAKAQALGYAFKYPTLDSAFDNLWG